MAVEKVSKSEPGSTPATDKTSKDTAGSAVADEPKTGDGKETTNGTLEDSKKKDKKTNIETEKKPNPVLRVFRYDRGSGEVKAKQIIELGAEKNLVDKKLSFLRSILARSGVFNSKDFGSPFCDTSGSDVSDDMQLDVYFARAGKYDEATGDYTIYYKGQKMFTEMSPEVKKILDKELDLKFKNAPDLLKAEVKNLESTFDAAKWAAARSSDKIIHAADLTERDWSVIIRSNCLLSAHKLVITPAGEGEVEVNGVQETQMLYKANNIERSPYNAFRLKARGFDQYEISSAMDNPTVKGSIASSLESSSYKFRIPRYRVDDDSYVTVFETKNQLQQSMAASSFSESSVEASLGGGMFGVSAAVSGGVAIGNTNQKAASLSDTKEALHVSYNFPRVTLYFSPECLEITEECKDDVLRVQDTKSLAAFTEKYGQIYARRVQLGGRLSSSETKLKTGTAGSDTQSDSLKAKAAASISYGTVSASVSASHEQGSKSSNENNESNLNRALAWEATGGDTLLCNNPPAWCSTVASHYNWRVVKMDDVIPLPQFLSSFPEFGEDVIKRFEDAANGVQNEDREVFIDFNLVGTGDYEGQALSLFFDDNAVEQRVMDELSLNTDKVPIDAKFDTELMTWIAATRTSIKCSTDGDSYMRGVKRVTAGEPAKFEYGAGYMAWFPSNPSYVLGPSITAPGYYDHSFLYLSNNDATISFEKVGKTAHRRCVEGGDEVHVFFKMNDGNTWTPTSISEDGVPHLERWDGWDNWKYYYSNQVDQAAYGKAWEQWRQIAQETYQNYQYTTEGGMQADMSSNNATAENIKAEEDARRVMEDARKGYQEKMKLLGNGPLKFKFVAVETTDAPPEGNVEDNQEASEEVNEDNDEDNNE